MSRKVTKLWKQFLETEAADFEAERKLTIKEIRKIGASKFVIANDWHELEDVKKWRTDIVEIIPCPHCRKEFGVMDDTLGLCDKCGPLFNLTKFYLQVAEICGEDANRVGQALALFMTDKDVRKQYFKEEKSQNEEISGKASGETTGRVLQDNTSDQE